MSSEWVALFSGGKDSSLALHRARSSGRTLTCAVTAQPRGDSYLFHTPATNLVSLLSESAGVDHVTFPVDEAESRDSQTAGETELAALEATLLEIDETCMSGIEGIVVGVVESRYQRERMDRLCNRYGYELYAPLWGSDPRKTLESMVDLGFDIRIIAVAADGLDESWLGRQLDEDAIESLIGFADSHGVHPMGEGGEYETLVVDGPHLDRPLQIDATPRWDGVRGHLVIEDARLGPTPGRS